MARERQSIFDYLEKSEEDVKENKYCKREDLGNEASVETFFVNRLLKDLGYRDKEIRTKESISELQIPKGRKKQPYKPDFVIVTSDKPRWLLDAKGTGEDVDDWIDQCSGYSLLLNRSYTGENPLQYYAITNGLIFKLFKWDEEEAYITLSFGDFFDTSPRFLALKQLIGAEVIRKGGKAPKKIDTITISKPPMPELKKVFKKCHRIIWKTEKMSPQPAFFEFVKIMFVKLWTDRKLHDDKEIGPLLKAGKPIPKNAIQFSTWYIESIDHENPIDALLFQPLIKRFNESVRRGIKKTIFDEDETIRLNSGTIKEVVKNLQGYDLYGIDEDLNGRMFETFLTATMRGKLLGQFFTPRSIVKLATKLAMPIASREKIEKSLDGCCGTGGFLIEILTQMRDQVRENSSFSSGERERMFDEIANHSIYGVDAGRDPPLARIARINMYLHGDGGSRIYAADFLDKTLTTQLEDDTESRLQLEELRKFLLEDGLRFDLVLTNPPFSMDYSEKIPNEKRILEGYELSSYGYKGTSKTRPSLRSSIMFIERYHDLLKPNGRLITVIDDSILSGVKYKIIRDYIREKFIIRAIISLHGDAFQRVGSRVKTSLLYLIKRDEGDTSQPDVFMYESRYIGLDDVPQKTPPSKAEKAVENALKETEEILETFNAFLSGEKGEWLISASRITDRLDAKYCIPRKNDVADEWEKNGYSVLKLEDIVDPVDGPYVKPKNEPDNIVTLLQITYEGIPQKGESRLGKEITYNELMKIQENDLAISNIAASLGSTAVIDKEHENLLTTPEFTVLRIKDKRFKPYYLWGIMRSPEIKARILSHATGISRQRVKWDFLQKLPIPLLLPDIQADVAETYLKSVESLKAYEKLKKRASEVLNEKLDLENEWAKQRLIRAKPPK